MIKKTLNSNLTAAAAFLAPIALSLLQRAGYFFLFSAVLLTGSASLGHELWLAQNPNLPPQRCEAAREFRDIDLRDSFPGERNQTDIGWCYAYAAADLVSYETHDNVSAFATAIAYDRKYHPALPLLTARTLKGAKSKVDDDGDLDDQKAAPHEHESGDTTDAVNLLLSQGYCQENEVKSDRFKLRDDDLRELIGYYDGYGLNVNEMVREFYFIFEQNFSVDRKHNLTAIAHAIFPKLPTASIDSVVDGAAAAVNNDPINSLIQSACRPKHADWLKDRLVSHDASDKEIQKFGRIGDDSIDRLIRYISNVLDQNQPVAIGHKSAVLEPDATDNHEEIIIGQHFSCSTGRLQYIVRNSFGIHGCLSELAAWSDPDFKKRDQCVKRNCVLPKGYDEFSSRRDPKMQDYATCETICEAKVAQDSIGKAPFYCDHGEFVYDARKLAASVIDLTYFRPN